MNEVVDWSERATYMFTRHGVTTAQAAEVIEDPEAVWIEPDYNSKSGRSIRVIGYCQSRHEILSILLVRDEGKVWGANGYRSNAKDQRLYYGKGESE